MSSAPSYWAPGRKLVRIAVFSCLSVAALGPVRGENRVVSSAPAADAEAVDLRLSNGEIKLSLDEAIEIALQRNLGVAVQRYSRAQARLGIQQAMGLYDLGLNGTLGSSHSESATASQLEGADVQKQDQDSLSIGVSQVVPTGGLVRLDWRGNKLETNNSFYTLNPSYSTGLDFTYQQPLLRNFGRDTTDFQIRVARLTSEQSASAFSEQLISTITSVEAAYWGVVEAREQLKVAEESKRLAVQLHDNNKIRVDVGTLAPLELVSSEAGIATREEEVILARANVGNAEDVLKTLLNLDGDAAWAASVSPETAPDVDHPQVDLAKSLDTALADRPELGREALAQQARDLEAAFYRGQTKPRLDLQATYGYNGLEGSLSKANDQITSADFPSWSVGLQFGYPLQNRSAKAQATISDLAAQQGRVGIEQLRQRITTEVRLAVRALETAEQELASARVSVRLQNANLDAEKKKFVNGLSTSFQILQVEEDLTSARSREVRAVTGYRRALVEYYRSTGTLLEKTGVEVAD